MSETDSRSSSESESGNSREERMTHPPKTVVVTKNGNKRDRDEMGEGKY